MIRSSSPPIGVKLSIPLVAFSRSKPKQRTPQSLIFEPARSRFPCSQHYNLSLLFPLFLSSSVPSFATGSSDDSRSLSLLLLQITHLATYVTYNLSTSPLPSFSPFVTQPTARLRAPILTVQQIFQPSQFLRVPRHVTHCQIRVYTGSGGAGNTRRYRCFVRQWKAVSLRSAMLFAYGFDIEKTALNK